MNPRLRRLQSDYELIREIYSGHPHVSVTAMGSVMPPESYRVQFRVRGVQLIGDQPEIRDSHEVEVMLPLRYPAEKPYAVPLEPIFHPNIKEYFCIADYWAAGTTLVDVIAKMSDMIQWRIYNPASPLDAVAARWAVEQEPTGIFPLGEIDLGVADFEVDLREDRPGPAEDSVSECADTEATPPTHEPTLATSAEIQAPPEMLIADDTPPASDEQPACHAEDFEIVLKESY